MEYKGAGITFSRRMQHGNPRRGVGLILGMAALAAALAQAASQAPDPKKALAREQLGLAREALSTLEELHKQARAKA